MALKNIKTDEIEMAMKRLADLYASKPDKLLNPPYKLHDDIPPPAKPSPIQLLNDIVRTVQKNGLENDCLQVLQYTGIDKRKGGYPAPAGQLSFYRKLRFAETELVGIKERDPEWMARIQDEALQFALDCETAITLTQYGFRPEKQGSYKIIHTGDLVHYIADDDGLYVFREAAEACCYVTLRAFWAIRQK